jgi:Zn-dependent peptidase ImmA (M78 family)
MTSKKLHILDRLAEEGITEVLVGYRSYKLNIKRGLREANEKCYGTADFDKGIISLEKDMDHETARETLVHELTHVVLELCGLGGHEETGMVSAYTNEEMTTLISRGWLMLINLNPKMFEIINENHEVL